MLEKLNGQAEKENRLNNKGVTNFTKSQRNESPLLNIYIKKYQEGKKNRLNVKEVSNFTKSQSNESPLLNVYIRKKKKTQRSVNTTVSNFEVRMIRAQIQ